MQNHAIDMRYWAEHKRIFMQTTRHNVGSFFSPFTSTNDKKSMPATAAIQAQEDRQPT